MGGVEKYARISMAEEKKWRVNKGENGSWVMVRE